MKVMMMMIVLATAVAITASAAAEPNVVVVKNSPLMNVGVDDYNFGFELSDGQAREERGHLKNTGTKEEALFVEGSSSYVDPVTKHLYRTTYTADKTGYHAKTSYVPV